jgi:phenylpropionate dioxygenase-like ring-hydroxylating dioxygenase large terminal subunit
VKFSVDSLPNADIVVASFGALGKDSPKMMLNYFHPILEAKRLRKGPVRVELAGQSYALFRDGLGHPAAVVDVCPHRFAPLSAGVVLPSGRLACRYHGWNFDREGHGCSPSQPTLKNCNVEALQVIEQQGYLWIANRSASPGSLPSLMLPDAKAVGWFSRQYRVPLHVLLANVIDVEHVNFVHLRGPARLGMRVPTSGKFEVKTYPDRVESLFHLQGSTVRERLLVGGASGTTIHDEIRFDPLRAIYTISKRNDSEDGPAPLELRVVLFMVPVTRDSSSMHAFASMIVRRAGLRAFAPLLTRLLRPLLALTAIDEDSILAHLEHIPYETTGMRLDRFDAHIVACLKALRNSAYLPILKLDAPNGALNSPQFPRHRPAAQSGGAEV